MSGQTSLAEEPAIIPFSGRNLAKDQLRAKIWDLLKNSVPAVLPEGFNPFGRIPAFFGAESCALRLAGLPIWLDARVIKCNPDTAQKEVRLRALLDRKVLYMAVPKLAHPSGCCFVEVDPQQLSAKYRVHPREASTWEGALRYGRLVPFSEMRPIDLAVVGCVAVARDGRRVGKGGGFADLELAMLRSFGLISSSTPVVTTVHSSQVVTEEADIPMEPQYTPLDWIVTPTEIVETRTTLTKPVQGIDWDLLQKDQLETIPALQQLQRTS